MQLNSTEQIKFDNTLSHRQARFGYGPLLGVLLANIISNSAIAKFSPLGALKITYEPVPWATYNGPSYYPHHQNTYWQPVKNHYGPPTTSIADTTEAQHIHHHHHISSVPNQQQIVNINGRPPTEIIIDTDYDTNDTNSPEFTEANSQSSIIEDNSYLETVKTNIESPRLVEPIAVESLAISVTASNEIDLTTLKERKTVKRGVSGRHSFSRRNKYSSQKRRRYTTTPEYYDYDSYEEFTTNRYKPRKRTKPREPVDSYEESTEEYAYDSYELTTKPKKRRRTTTVKPKRTKTKNKNKKKPQKVPVDYDDDDDYEKVEPVTRIIEIRPRQEVTTPETMITNGTTESSTTTTTSNSTNITGYGYGPSNGNENISFTYGPPHGEPQGVYGPPNPSYGPPRPAYGPPSVGHYSFPYTDWRPSHESNPNVLKKIQDIIEFDNIF